MPATTVIVHDDPEFAEFTLTSLRGRVMMLLHFPVHLNLRGTERG